MPAHSKRQGTLLSPCDGIANTVKRYRKDSHVWFEAANLIILILKLVNTSKYKGGHDSHSPLLTLQHHVQIFFKKKKMFLPIACIMLEAKLAQTPRTLLPPIHKRAVYRTSELCLHFKRAGLKQNHFHGFFRKCATSFSNIFVDRI